MPTIRIHPSAIKSISIEDASLYEDTAIQHSLDAMAAHEAVSYGIKPLDVSKHDDRRAPGRCRPTGVMLR